MGELRQQSHWSQPASLGLTTICYLLTDATSPPTTNDALEYRCGLPFDNHREARQTRCPERDRTTNRRTERYGDSHFTLDSTHKRRVASSILEDGATTDTLTHSTVWAPCAS